MRWGWQGRGQSHGRSTARPTRGHWRSGSADPRNRIRLLRYRPAVTRVLPEFRDRAVRNWAGKPGDLNLAQKGERIALPHSGRGMTRAIPRSKSWAFRIMRSPFSLRSTCTLKRLARRFQGSLLICLGLLIVRFAIEGTIQSPERQISSLPRDETFARGGGFLPYLVSMEAAQLESPTRLPQKEESLGHPP
jgi:hypothetical protein